MRNHIPGNNCGITLRNVSKSYRTPAGDFAALRDVNLEIGAAEFVALTGKSGSGKSTLLNLIAGIDPPTSGELSVGGQRIDELGENALARWRGLTVGFVFQFFQLLPTLTVLENVTLPMDFAGRLRPAERRQRALELLDMVGVGDQAGKFPVTLSGGQQQRVAIARALANGPAVVLADEPTGNLDSHTAQGVLELFAGVAASGATVIIATHERDIGCIVNRTIEIADGRIAASQAAAMMVPGSAR